MHCTPRLSPNEAAVVVMGNKMPPQKMARRPEHGFPHFRVLQAVDYCFVVTEEASLDPINLGADGHFAGCCGTCIGEAGRENLG